VKKKQKTPFRMVIDIISWAIFVILMIIACLLIYYVIASNIYAKKGKKYEPLFSLYTIVSGSMEPVIHVYDVVVNVKVTDPSTLKEGDIITYNSTEGATAGKTITHRINKIIYEDGTYYFRMKGDANIPVDENLITIDNIVGKVVLKLPQLGRAQFFIYKLGPYLFLILIPSFGVLIMDVIKMLNMSDTKKKVDKSLETKDDKLSKEETEKLKSKIKERIEKNTDNKKDKEDTITLDKKDIKDNVTPTNEVKQKKKTTKKKSTKKIVVTEQTSNSDINLDKIMENIKNGKY